MLNVVFDFKELGFSYNMGKTCTLLLGLIVLILAIDCCVADSKGDVSANTLSGPQLDGKNSSDQKVNGSNVVSNVVDKEKGNEGNQANSSPKGAADDDMSKNNSTSKGDPKDDLGSKEGDGNKSEDSSGGSDKEVPKGKGKDEDNATMPRKEGPADGCGPSNKCTDEGNKLVACLRVPGDESLDLSLLVQNNGKGPLNVTISAPDFVQLEDPKIKLNAKEHKEVKVSFTNGKRGNFILLEAGNGNCTLDIRDLIAHKFGKEVPGAHRFPNITSIPRSPVIAIALFAALLILASSWMCIRFRRKHSDSKYQRLDIELPVSGGEKVELETNDDWDNSWGDAWDDEEAPKTPAAPVTPSLSSKGLASRRLNKEAWND